MKTNSVAVRILVFAAAFLGASPLAWAEPATVTLKPFLSGLEQPLALAGANDGSKRIFVVEKVGRIRVVENGKAAERPFLDITAKTSRGSEQGLLGIAFSPKYSADGRLFVNYTDRKGDTEIAELTVSPTDKNFVDPATEKLLLKVDQPFANHNGGNLQFGPDGFLYIGLGDGGSAADPNGNGQNLGSLLGKMLRIDVGTPGEYKVPSDNPFVGKAGARAEIWSYGLRNPWRYSFDFTSGRLFAGDVGQNRFEEVDIIEKGKNYGWNIMEAGHCFLNPDCTSHGLAMPIAEYGRSEGICVTGGYVYRGKALPQLVGKYVFGDYGSGSVWTLTEQPDKTWKRELLLKKPVAISSFGEDDDKELYLTDLAGGVYRFE